MKDLKSKMKQQLVRMINAGILFLLFSLMIPLSMSII